MAKTTGTVEIRGLRVFARHGVSAQEAMVGNIFEVNVSLHFNAELSMRTDRIDLAVDYSEIVRIIKEEMQYSSKLLEHVVYNLRSAILSRYPIIEGGTISLYKLNPPIAAELSSVGFTFSW